MFDLSENMTRIIKESLSILDKEGFRYLSTEGYHFLQKISENLMVLRERKRISSNCSDNARDRINQQWATIFNATENWARFKANKSQKEVKEMNIFNQLWDNQNQFALISNPSLVRTLDCVIYFLNHVQKAIKEFEKNRKNLKEKFAGIYGNHLKGLHESLVSTKRQLIDAMSLRLKIALYYSHKKNHHALDIDDVVYYLSHSLNNRKSLNAEEQSILPAESRKTLFSNNENYYVKFYNAVKMYSDSKEQQKNIDHFHWSRIINKPVFPFTHGLPNDENMGSSKIDYYGFSFSEMGKKQTKKIAIPNFLYQFSPKKYQTPSWFYWQDNKILSFWEKRQAFLANLQRLWAPHQNMNRHQTDSQKRENELCMVLINTELKNLLDEKPSLFAFTYKAMLKKWAKALKTLRTDLLQAMRKPDDVIKSSQIDVNTNLEYPIKVKRKDSNILEAIKQNEMEYQAWLSDDFSAQPEIPLKPDWIHSKEKTPDSVMPHVRLCIHGSSKKNFQKNPEKPLGPQEPGVAHENKVSPKLLQKVY